MSIRHRSRAVVLALALTGALAGCSGPSAPTVTAASPTAPVIQPGRPGESATTLTGSLAAPTITQTTDPADAALYTEMIPHHAQALVLVDRSRSRLTDPRVTGIAERIAAEQKPEVDAMALWLKGHGRDVPLEATNPGLTAEGHSMHGASGMATPAEIAELGQATGVACDRLFLTLMIRHHEGALAMVDRFVRAGGGSDPDVERMTAEVNVTQSKQIVQMKEMLARLG